METSDLTRMEQRRAEKTRGLAALAAAISAEKQSSENVLCIARDGL